MKTPKKPSEISPKCPACGFENVRFDRFKVAICARCFSRFHVFCADSTIGEQNVVYDKMGQKVDYKWGAGRPVIFDHKSIVFLRECGLTYLEISLKLKVSQATIVRALKRHAQEKERESVN